MIQLPFPYVVPGGRFREIYYWDSYFTMLGLQVSGHLELIQHMADNFTRLIGEFGYIPNGNRSYFLGRSQPPFYSLMIKLLAEEKGDQVFEKYKPYLEKEYGFWMKGMDQASVQGRVAHLEDGTLLNRYWDEHDTPRPESFAEDVELSNESGQAHAVLFRHLRAAAESGWDFSSRWFRDAGNFSSIHTTDIIPVDLNCLLYHLEQMLSLSFRYCGDVAGARHFKELAENRSLSIQKYCWNEAQGFYFDYDLSEAKQKSSLTLAGAFPLFFNIASNAQAERVAHVLKTKFLKPGGFTTTLERSGQQWDAPNGWAPLQWITFTGLRNYGFHSIANQARSNWLLANTSVFERTCKMTEKYDVWNDRAEASGGEYPNQDGFGWTNGVFLALQNE